MSQPRTSGRVYLASVQQSLGGQPPIYIRNSAGDVVLLREWRVYGEILGTLAPTNTPSYSLRMQVGGSGSGSGPSMIELTGTGLVTSLSSFASVISGPTTTVLLTLALNIRKGIFWEAKRGKEFSIYGNTSGWDVTQNSGGDNTYSTSIVFEE